MVKSKANIVAGSANNLEVLIQQSVPISKKWLVQQIRFYCKPSLVYYLDVFVDDILLLTLFATQFTGVYTVKDEYKAGSRVTLVARTNDPSASFLGAYIQYDEIDNI